MTTLGIGNTGMLLATKFAPAPVLLATADQDYNNYKNNYRNIWSISTEGAIKRFKVGTSIWANNILRLENEILADIIDEDVVLFSSLGGGSGSSSLYPVSRILINNECRVLIVGVLPYKKEMNPPLANAVQAINNIMPIINKVSVMLFDNEKLRKQFDDDWDLVDGYIIKRVDYLMNLVSKYSIDAYSPLTIDESELKSVIFGGGFLDFSETFLEEKVPKFEYGSLNKKTKNCLVAMFVDKKEKEENMAEYHKIFTKTADKISTKVPNSRFIPGIIRGKINHSNSEQGISDRAYITIASGLSIENYLKKIEKIRDLAVKKAIAHMEIDKGSKFIDSKENRILDI